MKETVKEMMTVLAEAPPQKNITRVPPRTLHKNSTTSIKPHLQKHHLHFSSAAHKKISARTTLRPQKHHHTNHNNTTTPTSPDHQKHLHHCKNTTTRTTTRTPLEEHHHKTPTTKPQQEHRQNTHQISWNLHNKRFTSKMMVSCETSSKLMKLPTNVSRDGSINLYRKASKMIVQAVFDDYLLKPAVFSTKTPKHCVEPFVLRFIFVKRLVVACKCRISDFNVPCVEPCFRLQTRNRIKAYALCKLKI